MSWFAWVLAYIGAAVVAKGIIKGVEVLGR